MEERIGSVIKFFDKSAIAAVKLDFGDLAVGDTIHIKGPSTDVTQKVDSLEFDHKPVQKALRGHFAGIKLSQPLKNPLICCSGSQDSPFRCLRIF